MRIQFRGNGQRAWAVEARDTVQARVKLSRKKAAGRGAGSKMIVRKRLVSVDGWKWAGRAKERTGRA